MQKKHALQEATAAAVNFVKFCLRTLWHLWSCLSPVFVWLALQYVFWNIEYWKCLVSKKEKVIKQNIWNTSGTSNRIELAIIIRPTGRLFLCKELCAFSPCGKGEAREGRACNSNQATLKRHGPRSSGMADMSDICKFPGKERNTHSAVLQLFICCAPFVIIVLSVLCFVVFIPCSKVANFQSNSRSNWTVRGKCH